MQSMHAVSLIIALFWQSVVPFSITPGMTRQQVEASLGQPLVKDSFGPRGANVTTYYNHPNLSVNYSPGGLVRYVEHNVWKTIP